MNIASTTFSSSAWANINGTQWFSFTDFEIDYYVRVSHDSLNSACVSDIGSDSDTESLKELSISSEGSKGRVSNQLNRHESMDETLSATQSSDVTCMAPIRGSNPDDEPGHTGSYQPDETGQVDEQLHRIREDTVSEPCRRKKNASIYDELKKFTEPTVPAFTLPAAESPACPHECKLTMSPTTISDYEAAIRHHLERLRTHSEAKNAAIWTWKELDEDGKRQKKKSYQKKEPKVTGGADTAAAKKKKSYWKEKGKMDEMDEKLQKLDHWLPKLLDDLKERISPESELYRLLSTRNQFWPSTKSLFSDPIIDELKEVIADKLGTLNLADKKQVANRKASVLFRCRDKMFQNCFKVFHFHGKELKDLIIKLLDLKLGEVEPPQAKRKRLSEEESSNPQTFAPVQSTLMVVEDTLDKNVETMKKKIFSDLSLLLAGSDLVSGHGVVLLLFSLCRHANQSFVQVRTYFTVPEQTKLDSQLIEAIPYFHRNVREKALVLGEESLMRLRTVRSGIQFLSDDLATPDSPDLYFAVSDFMESPAVFALDKKLRIFKGMRGQYDRGDDCEDLRGVPDSHFWWSELERGDSEQKMADESLQPGEELAITLPPDQYGRPIHAVTYMPDTVYQIITTTGSKTVYVNGNLLINSELQIHPRAVDQLVDPGPNADVLRKAMDLTKQRTANTLTEGDYLTEIKRVLGNYEMITRTEIKVVKQQIKSQYWDMQEGEFSSLLLSLNLTPAEAYRMRTVLEEAPENAPCLQLAFKMAKRYGDTSIHTLAAFVEIVKIFDNLNKDSTAQPNGTHATDVLSIEQWRAFYKSRQKKEKTGMMRDGVEESVAVQKAAKHFTKLMDDKETQLECRRILQRTSGASPEEREAAKARIMEVRKEDQKETEYYGQYHDETIHDFFFTRRYIAELLKNGEAFDNAWEEITKGITCFLESDTFRSDPLVTAECRWEEGRISKHQWGGLIREAEEWLGKEVPFFHSSVAAYYHLLKHGDDTRRYSNALNGESKGTAHNSEVYFKSMKNYIFGANLQYDSVISQDGQKISTKYRDPQNYFGVTKCTYDVHLGRQTGAPSVATHFPKKEAIEWTKIWTISNSESTV